MVVGVGICIGVCIGIGVGVGIGIGISIGWISQIWKYLGSSGSIWEHLGASGRIWQHLGTSGCLAASGRAALAAAWIIWQHVAAPGGMWKQLAATGRIWVNVCPASLHTSIKRERHWKYECLRAHFETACQNRIVCGHILPKNRLILPKNIFILKSVFKMSLPAGSF